MTIKIFGCSFVAGTDLSIQAQCWPGQVATNLNTDHDNHAKPGIGNLQILEAILRESRQGCMNVISWTWTDRFDFCPASDEKWATLRPSLDHESASHYFRCIHGQYRDVLTSLVYIQTAIDFMRRKRISFWMTSIDTLLTEPVDPVLHDPTALSQLQSSVTPHLSWFEDLTFLEWCRRKTFTISKSWHPLETAHREAAYLVLPQIKSIYATRHRA